MKKSTKPTKTDRMKKKVTYNTKKLSTKPKTNNTPKPKPKTNNKPKTVVLKKRVNNKLTSKTTGATKKRVNNNLRKKKS